MFPLPASIVSVLQPFACLFTAPTLAHLHVLLTGTLLAQGPRTVTAALRAMGHEVRAQSRQGDAHSIWVAPDGTPYGVPDRRTPDAKASVPQRLTPTAAGR